MAQGIIHESVILPLASLHPWDKNPREQYDIERLQVLLRKRGQMHDLLIDDRDPEHRVVLGGNSRLKAMQLEGWEKAKCILVKPESDKEAVEMAFEDNETFGKYINEQVIELAREYDIDTKISIVTDTVIVGDLVQQEDQYSDANKEIDIDTFDDEYLVKLKFSESEYEEYLSLIAAHKQNVKDTAEKIVLDLLRNVP